MPGRIRPGMTAAERVKKNNAMDERKAQLADDMFREKMKQGKVTPQNIQKIKEQIARKTGAYPLGDTN
jgi:ribosomal protein L29